MWGIFEKTFNIAKQALKLRSYKHSLLASNIANVDTPGYRRKDIPFEKVMQAYLSNKGLPLKTTNPKHITGKPTSIKEIAETYKENTLGTPNNVSLEEEITELIQNQVLYEATLQALAKEIERLKEAITEGGR
ncbi:flagellar basal body rod protein FlgB [Thermodesulfobacterium hydrogeniphilum]|uniref:flagellar basal body rod protein FlgB n=1 Tax=Thermodesulfobacterium hydrogeniphilum TaxID=161156 RepID=UPI0005713D60|nr:flagellar basal body rod protein FlgB [Thermodesulfobacterium hydrogeniphilum]